MANPREEMMLDLEVGASDIPCEQPIIGTKVVGRPELILDPLGFGFCWVTQRQLVGFLDDVRQLEHDPEDESANHMQSEQPDRELPPGDVEHQERNDDHANIIYCLACEQRD